MAVKLESGDPANGGDAPREAALDESVTETGGGIAMAPVEVLLLGIPCPPSSPTPPPPPLANEEACQFDVEERDASCASDMSWWSRSTDSSASNASPAS